MEKTMKKQSKYCNKSKKKPIVLIFVLNLILFPTYWRFKVFDIFVCIFEMEKAISCSADSFTGKYETEKNKHSFTKAANETENRPIISCKINYWFQVIYDFSFTFSIVIVFSEINKAYSLLFYLSYLFVYFIVQIPRKKVDAKQREKKQKMEIKRIKMKIGFLSAFFRCRLNGALNNANNEMNRKSKSLVNNPICVLLNFYVIEYFLTCM